MKRNEDVNKAQMDLRDQNEKLEHLHSPVELKGEKCSVDPDVSVPPQRVRALFKHFRTHYNLICIKPSKKTLHIVTACPQEDFVGLQVRSYVTGL